MQSVPVSTIRSAANSSGTSASGAHSDNRYDPGVGSALKSLVDNYGVALFGQAGRLRGLLQDECPQAKREISVLLQALDERVPQDLMRVHSGEPISSLSPRLAKRLVDEKAMSPNASRWAVSIWAQGLGLESVADEPLPFDNEWSAALPPAPPIPDPPYREDAHVDPQPVKRKPMGAGLAIAAALALAAGGWFFFMQPKLDISGVDVQGPLVGDGKPHAVQLAFEARNTSLQSVEVHFVRGDGDWNAKDSNVDVPGEAAGQKQGRIPAGTLAFKTARPVSATFAYVLVAKDGKRSAPFERSFTFVPPLLITDVSVPRSLRPGQPFAVAIKYQKGGADIVQVERRVIDSTVPWLQKESVMPLKIDSESGQFDYKFDPFAQPMNSTIELTLVDAQGVRSEPRRVALNIASPVPVARNPDGAQGVVVSVREIRQAGETTGVGAVAAGIIGGIVGNRAGHGGGRGLLTALGIGGGAYAGNEIERNMRATSTWEITVRLNDGGTRVLHQPTPPRLNPGDRVTVAGGTVVAARN